MKKAHILAEIRRTASANGGVALGEARFEAETRIQRRDWYGVHWARWSDAVQEAGLVPNQLNTAFEDAKLLASYARYAQELGCLPTMGDLRLKRRADADFPSWNTFGRLGTKVKLVRLVREHCQGNVGLASVTGLCDQYLLGADQTSAAAEAEDTLTPEDTLTSIGYVYLLKHGSRREYKIGRTNNPLRREGELGIQLPEKCQPVHYIKTDDPEGVEAYWHRRFASKRKEGEWFALTAQDVRAFKRWRRIY